ncbi:hypothetical protein Tco_0643604 [Tanacetum coccineum]
MDAFARQRDVIYLVVRPSNLIISETLGILLQMLNSVELYLVHGLESWSGWEMEFGLVCVEVFRSRTTIHGTINTRARSNQSYQAPIGQSVQVRIMYKQKKHTKLMGFTLYLLTQQAQVSLKWIASLAIRVRSFSDPTDVITPPMIGKMIGYDLLERGHQARPRSFRGVL